MLWNWICCRKLNILQAEYPHEHLTWGPVPLQAGCEPAGFPQFVLHQVTHFCSFQSSGIGLQLFGSLAIGWAVSLGKNVIEWFDLEWFFVLLSIIP